MSPIKNEKETENAKNKNKLNKNEIDIGAHDSDNNKTLKCLYIHNSIKYKENCDEDFEMLKHRISDFKKLAGTVNVNSDPFVFF